MPVAHIAELSNDPIGESAPNITYEINHKGSVRLAELARQGRHPTLCLYVVLQCLRSGCRRNM